MDRKVAEGSAALQRAHQPATAGQPLGSANDNVELKQRVELEARMLLEDRGARTTSEDIDAVIRHQIWMFGGEARMGAIDRLVLDTLRRMAAGGPDCATPVQPTAGMDRSADAG